MLRRERSPKGLSQPLHVGVIGPALDMTGGISLLYRYVRASLPESVRPHWIFTRNSHGSALLSVFWVIAAIFRMTALAMMNRLDVMHINVSHGASAMRKAAIIWWSKSVLRRPVLVHVHTGAHVLHRIPNRLRPVVRKQLRRCDYVGILAGGRRDEMLDLFGSTAKVELLRIGVPDVSPDGQTRLAQGEAASGAPTTPKNASGRAFDLVFAGLLGTHKGLDLLFAALQMPQCTDMRLVIAGPGDIGYWRGQATQHDLNDRVTFLGPVSSGLVQQLLTLSDAMVLPSRGEGLPVILMEALSAGAVVCVSKVGAVPEVLVDGVTGFLIPTLTPQDIAHTLQRARDSQSIQGVRTAARALWEQSFDCSKTSESLANVWYSVAQSRSSHDW